MKNNIVKNILRAIAATAMAATIFIGTGKDAKAYSMSGNEANMTMAEYTSLVSKGKLPAATRYNCSMTTAADENALLTLMRKGLVSDKINIVGVEFAEVDEAVPTDIAMTGGVTVHPEMLDLINADRAANGAGALVWNADLEAYGLQRVLEVTANYQSAEYENAKANGLPTGAIAHKGMRAGTSENALRAYEPKTAETSNASWIKSTGHHANRIKAGYTQYAAVSYLDPLTGEDVWIELFADNSFKGVSSFDYIRYAKDYPDLAAAFGQDKNALYKHYRTYGRNEGRKAYNTDGTLIK